jgi:hypothetical protein
VARSSREWQREPGQSKREEGQVEHDSQCMAAVCVIIYIIIKSIAKKN